jgi:hypothetical protein
MGGLRKTYREREREIVRKSERGRGSEMKRDTEKRETVRQR